MIHNIKKISVSMMVFIIGITLFFAFLYINYSKDKLVRDEFKNYSDDVKNLTISIDHYMENFENAIVMFSLNENLINIADKTDQLYDPTLKLFKNFQESYQDTAFAYFVPSEKLSNSKILVSWPDTSDELKRINWDPKRRPWFKEALKSPGNIMWTTPYLDATTQKSIITASRAIYSNKDFIGVIAIDIFVEDIQRRIEQFKTFKNGSPWIVFSNENQFEKIAVDKEYSDLIQHLFNDSSINIRKSDINQLNYKYDNKEYYVSYYISKLTGWKIGAIIEKSQLLSAFNKIYKETVVILMVTIFVVLIIFTYIFGNTSKILNLFFNKDKLRLNKPDNIFEESYGNKIAVLFKLSRLKKEYMDSKGKAKKEEVKKKITDIIEQHEIDNGFKIDILKKL